MESIYLKNNNLILLNNIVYDKRARDGTWCTLPYINHKKGCPKYPKCMKEREDFNKFPRDIFWYAVIEQFDLEKHAEKMKLKHPDWTERQCRNLLYWQGGVRKRLREKTRNFAGPGDIILDIPEANGVDIFSTLEAHGIPLDRHNPNIVRKVMLVGKVL